MDPKKFVAIFVCFVLVMAMISAVYAADLTVEVTPDDVSPSYWHPANERDGGVSEINGDMPDSDGGPGSLKQYLPAPAGNSPKTDFEYYLIPPAGFGKLSDRSILSFEWYRDSSSTAPSHLTPAFRVYVYDPDWPDGPSTFLLVWEGVYNGYPAAGGAAPTDQWIEENVTNQNFWRIPQFINNVWKGYGGCSQVNVDPTDWSTCLVYNRTLDDWTFSENAEIFGFNVGLGSGWSGSYLSYADFVKAGFNGGDTTTYNFELGDDQGPVASDLVADPNPVAIGSQVIVSAVIDDTNTGGSNVASAEFSIDGSTWHVMAAQDGTFNSVSEVVEGTFTSPEEPGIYDLCVKGTDEPGNVGEESCTMLVVFDPDGGFVTGGGWITGSYPQSKPIYDTIPELLPGSYPSVGYEATSTDEFGDQIQFGGSERLLDNVIITLTNWACENDYDYVAGSWVKNRANEEACLSTPGSGFDHPITLNIYEVDDSSGHPEPGTLLATKTETFFIPFRPSWDSVNCPGPESDVPFGGTWFDPVLGACVHGYNSLHTFDFSADGIVLPEEIIFGIAYNTSHHGNVPINENGPYNSLNVAVTTDPASVGLNVGPDDAFYDTSYGGFYCDGGTGGTDFFRGDFGCWGGYTPVVEFNIAESIPGRANFGFVSKYARGKSVPTGNTEFVFQDAGLNFHSISYDWLIVTGSDFAKFKGVGQFQGRLEIFNFQVWAGDGTGSNGGDTFRIKIWNDDGTVYDNGPNQEIGGGNIVVHNRKN